MSSKNNNPWRLGSKDDPEMDGEYEVIGITLSGSKKTRCEVIEYQMEFGWQHNYEWDIVAWRNVE